ncbi:sigma-54-dependent Fis family transcriptional regulator [Pseudomonas aeruginosa]|nr:sigma-54-dependent Fis family transcriptional regulator [Pseudomonas aeruginosa]
MSDQVIFVDDEATIREAVQQWLELSGFEVRLCLRAEECLGALDKSFAGVVISDVRMPGMDGLQLLANLQAVDRDLPVIMVTGHGDVPMAVEAMRQGAYDFIEKPFTPERLLGSLRRALEKRRLVLENRRLKEQASLKDQVDARLLGVSKPMEALRRQVLALAPTPVNVLIRGETGSGKELVARCLHDFGPRADKPFVALNCAAIPEQLFESELFGHESGAFTGAQGKRIGKLEHAHGGTLFLDEIESMPLAQQVKLLRVLQEQQLERLGSNQSIHVDLRVIAATKPDLLAEARAGRFREDLVYRRELANAAERHVLGLERGDAEEGGGLTSGLAERMEAFEAECLRQALGQCRGDIKAVMELLQLPRRTLNEKMLRHGLSRSDFVGEEPA